MSHVSAEDVRQCVLDFLDEDLKAQGRRLQREISDECDLLTEGLVDSVGFLTMTARVEEHFGVEIDYEELDPDEMAILGPFCRHVAEEARKTKG